MAAPTPEQNRYIREAFGIDPDQYWSTSTSGATQPRAPSQPPAAPTATPSLATSPTASAPRIRLTSNTEAPMPTNRARTRIGVGERVTLRVTPGPGTWVVSGATLDARTGNQVMLTAPGAPGVADVSVNVGDQSQSIRFTIVAPNAVHMERNLMHHEDNGQPNAGFEANIYIGPDDVSFANITVKEVDAHANADGYWERMRGQGHHPGPPCPMTQVVEAGKGTQAFRPDHCWSSYFEDGHGPDWHGQYHWDIDWSYSVNGYTGHIATVTEMITTDAEGTTTISKAGASATFRLSPAPTAAPAGAVSQPAASVGH